MTTYGSHRKRVHGALPFLLVLPFMTGLLSAHQPHIATSSVTQVANPDISQAFYAELKGGPDRYRFALPDSLLLYLNLLVPRMAGVHKDFSARLYLDQGGRNSLVGVLDGAGAGWSDYHEPVANDDYFKGPESRAMMPPGEYTVEITCPSNLGKYVLAIGERESFPPREIARVTAEMPALKKYFGKSPLTAYFNYVGLFLGATAVVVAGVVVLVVALARR